jgi:type II secretory pathway component GspD/PulD (secretin)
MMTSARAFLIASLMISCTSWATVEDIVTIKPKHRLAEDIAALVRPSLESGETVITGSGLLIIKATPDHIDKIRNLVQQLDTPQRRLLITVAQGRGLTTEELGASFGGRREGLKGHIYQTDTQGLGQQIQRIQTMDGQSARIDFGEQIAVPTQNLDG